MKVTILLPHYRTLTLTKLCLYLLRQYTDLTKARVIVIDNDSQDESLAYLRCIPWIDLIERQSEVGEGGALAHSRALDLGLREVNTPYVLSIHTDTLVKQAGWLDYLLSQIEGNFKRAGVGAWKLESKTLKQRCFKMIERFAQLAYYRLMRQGDHNIQGIDKNHYYFRSYCALYRTEVVKSLNLHFSDNNEVAGKSMHKSLVEAGYDMFFIPSHILAQYLDHINHATTILNPELSRRTRSVDKGMRRFDEIIAKIQMDTDLNSLDLLK